jgi:hypothetical protein
LPSGIKRITIMLNQVSTNGTSTTMIRIGTGGSPDTSGYVSASVSTGYTAGFGIVAAPAAANITAKFVLDLMDSSTNTWNIDGTWYRSDNATPYSISGIKALSGVLNIVRLTTSGGTDAFDSGTMNISYE